MASKEGKKFVSVYRMTLQEYYLLLRLQMERQGCKTINGVADSFFAKETYEKSEKRIKDLVKKDMLVQDAKGNLLIREGLVKALDNILESAYCMNFQNNTLQKKGIILSFYYAKDCYVGVLQDKKETLLVANQDVQAVYTAFEKHLERKEVSPKFQADRWKLLWEGKEHTEDHAPAITQPVQEAIIAVSANRLPRERYSVTLVADKKQIQILSGSETTAYQEVSKETAGTGDWYGVIVRELERLKETKPGTEKAKEKQKKKTEYQKITQTSGFPSSGIEFIFWSLKRLILNLPRMAVQLVKRKAYVILAYLLWGGILFFYNMYATCYLNDTFMLDRRAIWKNLTPYLMAGTLRTPSELKGFQTDWGISDTAFLVWPLMMMLTMVGRHLILQMKNKKAGFFKDVAAIPQAASDCKQHGFGIGRAKWLTFAAVWAAGFFIMNPITFVLMGLYALLIFAQGSSNGMVQFLMMWKCASSRKKVDAGLKKEPDSRSYRSFFLNVGKGFLLYELVSLVLWFVADYHPWARLIVSLLMVVYALIQAFCPKLFGNIAKKCTTKNLVLLAVLLIAAGCFSEGCGIVLADDGGWSESGRTLAGLLQNAGFSTIIGLTILTIGLALGGPLAWVAAGSCIIGGTNFIIGLTDTGAGEYVRKSARQYFFGTEDGESKTIWCSTVEVANFVAGFMNPAAGSSAIATQVFHAGKVATDMVSTSGDIAATYVDIRDYVNGEGDVSMGDIAWDIAGLGFDFAGLKEDWGEFSSLNHKIRTEGPNADLSDYQDQFWSGRKAIDDTAQNDINNMEADLNAQKQSALAEEKLRHETKLESIQESMDKAKNNDLSEMPSVNNQTFDGDTYESTFRQAEATEWKQHAENASDIRSDYNQQIMEGRGEIMNQAAKDKNQLLKDTVKEEVGPDTIYDVADQADVVDKVKDAIEKASKSNEAAETPTVDAAPEIPTGSTAPQAPITNTTSPKPQVETSHHVTKQEELGGDNTVEGQGVKQIEKPVEVEPEEVEAESVEEEPMEQPEAVEEEPVEPTKPEAVEAESVESPKPEEVEAEPETVVQEEAGPEEPEEVKMEETETGEMESEEAMSEENPRIEEIREAIVESVSDVVEQIKRIVKDTTETPEE